jgi:hypothetical protein
VGLPIFRTIIKVVVLDRKLLKVETQTIFQRFERADFVLPST